MADQQVALQMALDQADDYAVLVMDDLHVLHGNEHALHVIEPLTQDPPSALGLVLLTRERPPLPSLPRSVASGAGARLEAPALAFTDAEAKAVLEVLGAPEATRPGILGRALGWPLAVALLGRRAADADPGRTEVPVDSSDLDEFIGAEVFDPLPGDDRDVLQACAVAAYFDGDVAAEVAQRTDAPVVLHRLQVRTGLISAVGDGPWLRMHALLREHCLSRLAREDPARLATYRGRAAIALARLGELDEATELALDVESWGLALELIDSQVEALNARGAWPTLASWLGRLPAPVLADSPALALLQARVAVRQMHLPEAHALLDQIERRPLSPRDHARALVYRGIAYRQARRLDDALDAFRRARVIIEESEPDDSDLRIEVDFEEGTVFGIRGELAPAVRELQRAAATAEAHGKRRLAADAYANLGLALQFLGRLAEAGEAFREARQRWEYLGEREYLQLTLNNEATSAYLLGQLDEAERSYRMIAREATPGGRMAALAALGLADIARDRGQLDVAEPLYAEAIEVALAIGHRGVEAAAVFGQTMIAVERGAIAGARRQFEHHLRVTEQQRAAEFASRFRIGLAQTLLSEGRTAEAATALQEILDDPGGGYQRRQQVLLMRATAEFRQGDRASMLATLEALRELVDVLGYDQLSVAQARLCADMLADPEVATVAGGVFARLLVRAGMRKAADIEALVSSDGPPGPADTNLEPTVDLVVRAFGVPAVTRPGDDAPDLPWRSERSKELLLLLLTRSGPLTREEIEVALWPDASAQQLSSLFHSNLHRLRRAVGDHVVIRERGGYGIDPALRIDFDVRRFEEHLAAAADPDASASVHAASLRAAIELYTGGFARTVEAEWAQEMRARLDDRFVQAALTLARLDIAASEFAEPVELSERVLELDPLNEEAVRHLIAAHVGAGFPDLALRAYRRLQQLTESELGAPPSPETRRALERGLAGRVSGT
ncbi:MAG: BTAD domain-containing putative transcriptional regulator [Dehalococcoidia bacterium]